MWAHKRADNAIDGLDKHVAEHGVKAPVTLGYSKDWEGAKISDGHHRVAAAVDADPNMEVPVQHRSFDYRDSMPDNQAIEGWDAQESYNKRVTAKR